MQANGSQDLPRTAFQLLALGALIAASFWIVRPFVVALAYTLLGEWVSEGGASDERAPSPLAASGAKE